MISRGGIPILVEPPESWEPTLPQRQRGSHQIRKDFLSRFPKERAQRAKENKILGGGGGESLSCLHASRQIEI